MEVPSALNDETQEYFDRQNSEAEQSKEIAELFSVEVAGFYANETRAEGMYSFDEFSMEEILSFIHEYLRFFTREERDFILLHFISGKTQVELTEIFNKTQPALCNDSGRIKSEIIYARKLKRLTGEVLEFLGRDDTGLNYNTRNILLVFFYSMSVTRTSHITGINAMLCRSRILSAIELLERLGHHRMHDIFQDVFDHLNGIKKSVSDDLTKRPYYVKDAPSGKKQTEFDFD